MLFFEFFLAFCFACFLSSLASFFNVVIFRTARDKSFVRGRSVCEHCQKTIAWYDNIPVVSFLMLRGRCRHCRKKISPMHFVTELGTFILGFFFIFSLLYLPWWQSLSLQQSMLYFLIFFVLIFILLADLQYLIVPDFFIALLSILVILLQFVSRADWVLLGQAVLIACLFFVGLYFAAKKVLKKEALGLGDIKLMIPLALLLSWPKIVVSIFLSFIIGGFFAMLMLITGKKKIGQAVPFAPFLVVASLVSLFYGEMIWQWYFGLLF